jgi:hypothetical protein
MDTLKKLILMVLLLLGGMMAWNYHTSGELTLLPPGPLSGEEQELRRLEKDFDRAAKEFDQAQRSAGLAGLDTTGDAEAAMDEVKRIERKLLQLERRLVSEDEHHRAEGLRLRIRKFKRRAGA